MSFYGNSEYAFKTKFSFQDRLDESQRIRQKHPDRIPVIC